MKKKFGSISIGLSNPGNNIFLFKFVSKNGAIDFIVGIELKFISSAIKMQPF